MKSLSQRSLDFLVDSQALEARKRALYIGSILTFLLQYPVLFLTETEVCPSANILMFTVMLVLEKVQLGGK